jgi:uncharacterized protein YdbL (DUF1318 family)
MTNIRTTLLAAAAGLVAITSFAAPAQAQRDPAYAAARANGSIGEQTDGYIGIVGTATAALQDMVNDINIRRRAVYTQRSQQAQNRSTIEEYALTAGCQAIMRTVPGEKYQAPDGSWQTRTTAEPQRLAICP